MGIRKVSSSLMLLLIPSQPQATLCGSLCILCASKRIAFGMHLSMCLAAHCTTNMIDIDYISHLSLLGLHARLVYEARRHGCRLIFVRYQMVLYPLSFWRFVLYDCKYLFHDLFSDLYRCFLNKATLCFFCQSILARTICGSRYFQ